MLLDGEAQTLARKAVEMALSGDPAALWMCLDRTAAPRREQSVSVDLPAILSSAEISGAMAALVGAAARGRITAREAFDLSQTIEIYLRAIDATDFEWRLRQLAEARAAAPMQSR
jgi:hypothetical protein